MKLSILAAAAGFLVVPVLAYAQTDTTMKDTAMSSMKMSGASATAKKSTQAMRAARRKAAAEAKESTATERNEKAEANESAATRRAERRAARAGGMSTAMAGDTTAVRTSSSNGTDCPRGCPTSKGAAGLTGVQFLALQQELRDRGCGNSMVTGTYDGATRRAVSSCARRLGVANNAGAVLVAFNVGFGAGDIGTPPPKME